jgi:4-amino-4-deoxy-L-arabinose transferase-like glycosyltransferase
MSGASAIAVSFAATLVTGVFIYKLALLVTGDRVRGFAAAAMLALSPSFLYFGVIPMLPATVMAAATANVYFMTRWARDGRGMSLLAAGLTLTLATLAHFDTWILAPIELAIVLAFAHRRWRSRTRTEAATLLWLLAGGYGIAVFLLMNLLIYGDPLSFLTPYAESDGMHRFVGESRTGQTGSVSHLLAYPEAAWLNAGPALAVAGLAGLVCAIVRWRRDAARLVPLLLLYPVVWYTLQAGSTGTYIVPADKLGDWNNLRYGISLLPAFAYFAAVGLPRRAGAVAAIVAVAVGGVLMLSGGRVAGWEDAAHDLPGDHLEVSPAAHWLHARAGDGRIFFPVHDRLVDRFELRSRLELRNYVDANDSRLYADLRKHPERVRPAGVRWIVWIGVAGPDLVGRTVRVTGARLCYDAASTRKDAPRLRIYSVEGDCGGQPVRRSVQ